MKKQLAVIIVLLSGSLLAVFNSCSADHSGSGALSSSGFDGNCAIADEMTLFSKTFHPFLQRQCVTCHIPGGVGPGSFASSGLLLAYDSFSTVGFSKISQYAADDTHNPPYTGSHHLSEVNKISNQWIAGLDIIQQCKNGGIDLNEDQDSPDRINTKSKAINPQLGRASVVTWNLGSDLISSSGSPLPDLQGATLSVRVEIMDQPGQPVYVVSRPSVDSTNTDVHIKSLLIKINGQAVPTQRTFYYVETDIRAWNTSHPDYSAPNASELKVANNLISDGSMVAEGTIRTTDVISISFEKIEPTTLPPREEFPIVQFSNSSMRASAEGGDISITVKLDKPWTELVATDIELGPDTTVRDECCTSVLDENFDEIFINNFDRDIEIEPHNRVSYAGFDNAATSVLRVTFSPGETTKTIKVRLVENHRDEPEETIHLRFKSDGLRKARLGPSTSYNNELYVTIPDDDPAYSGTARTYSQLMQSGGVLHTYCIRCHNSVDNRGGYDLTNYKQMIDEGILIPGNANSIMYQRMNTDDGVLDPMPLEGLITDLRLRRQVEQWIIEGAKNN